MVNVLYIFDTKKENNGINSFCKNLQGIWDKFRAVVAIKQRKRTECNIRLPLLHQALREYWNSCGTKGFTRTLHHAISIFPHFAKLSGDDWSH